MADPGTVVGEVTAEAAAQTGLRPGTPVVAGGADTQLGLLGAGVRAGEFTVLAGTFWQNTILTAGAAHRPAGPAADAVPRDPGRMDARGHRLLLRHGHALVPGRVLRPPRWRPPADRGVDPYVVMEEQAAQIPPGSNGVYAILSNLMNARRWVHASPSFVGFDLGDPAGSGRAAGDPGRSRRPPPTWSAGTSASSVS